MRLLAGLLPFLLLVPPVSAHGEGLGHLSVEVIAVAPGQSEVRLIDGGEEGPLRKGWIFGLGAILEAPGTLNVTLSHEGTRVDGFRWTHAGTQFNTTRLTHDDHVEVTFHNPTNRTVRAGFYFDQSCNCAAKTIPLPGGTVFFDYEFPAKRRVKIEVPILEGWGVEAAIATTEARGKYWPHDFQVLVNATRETPGMLRFDFLTAEAGPYFMVIKSTRGVVFPASQDQWFELTPLVKVEEPAGSPSLSGAWLALLLVLAAWAWRRSA